MTDTDEKLEHMIYEIESSSGLKVTKLINNTNLLDQTNMEVVIEGHSAIKRISDKLNIPIGFVSGFADLVGGVEKEIDIEFFSLKKLIKLPWN
jgi:protein gp37